MPQKSLGKSRAKRSASAGSARKKVGKSRHSTHSMAKKDQLRTKAGAAFITLIEQDLASKLPSDQRDKLSVLKQNGPRLDPKAAKHKKKPLTRGKTKKRINRK